MDDNWEYWNRNAKRYDRDVVQERDTLYTQLEELMSKHLSEDMDVLELCSGSGNLAKAFSSSVHSWTGVDYSDEMVNDANDLGISNASFLVGDAQDIGFPDESFDAVVNINALQVIPSPEKCLKEAGRVLKRDGRILCSAYVEHAHMPQVMTSIEENDGFMSYHKWKSEDFVSLVENSGFNVVSSCVLINEAEAVCYISAEKTK